MALDCVRLYISLISEFFLLSDIVVMQAAGATKNLPPMLPTNAHSISTAHYLMRLSGELHENVTELNGMEISPEVSSGLKSLLESVKWRFTDIHIHAWLRGMNLHCDPGTYIHTIWSDTSLFYYLEGWRADSSNLHITQYLSHMEHFQRHLTTAAFKLGGGIDPSSSVSSSKPVKQNPIPQAFVAKITKAFLSALYAFLDGLVLLASDESPIVTGNILSKEDSSATSHLDLLDLTDGVSQSQFRDDDGVADIGAALFNFCTFPDILYFFSSLLPFPSRPVGHPHVASDIKLQLYRRCVNPKHVEPIGGRLWHFTYGG
jgi:exocyst complex component 2